MSMGKMQMQQTVAPLVQAVAHLVASGQTVAAAEATVCQITMDMYAWVLQAIADSSPWPDPHVQPGPAPTPAPAPAPVTSAPLPVPSAFKFTA
jgi:hypothetical protein